MRNAEGWMKFPKKSAGVFYVMVMRPGYVAPDPEFMLEVLEVG